MTLSLLPFRRSQLTRCRRSHQPFAAHVPESRYDVQRVQELLSHDDLRTTKIYTYVLNRGGHGARGAVTVCKSGKPRGLMKNPYDTAKTVAITAIILNMKHLQLQGTGGFMTQYRWLKIL